MSMNVIRDRNSNMIIGNPPKNAKIKFLEGCNNIIFFAGNTKGNLSFEICVNDALIFIGNNTILNGEFRIGNKCLYYIDSGTTIEDPSIFDCLSEGSIILGRDCMLARGCYIRNDNCHFIYDTKTKKQIPSPDTVIIGDHVWLGYGVSIIGDIFIGSGSIIGATTTIAGHKIIYSNTINAKSPIQETRDNIFWIRECTSGWNDRITYTDRSINNTDDFTYNFTKSQCISPYALREKLKTFDTALDKLDFVYNFLYLNNDKNRFAYSKTCNFNDIISNKNYERTFSKLTFNRNSHKFIQIFKNLLKK